MKARHLPACIAIALALLGCATEQPTRPGPSPMLESTPVTLPLLVSSSEFVSAAIDSEGTWVANLGDSEDFLNGQYDDIVIGFEIRQTVPDSVRVYEYSTEQWMHLQSALWRPLICPPWAIYCYALTSRALSQIRGTSAYDFLGSSGTVRIIADGAFTVVVALKNYSDEYHFRTVRNEWWWQQLVGSATFANNQLYMYSSHPQRDSIHALDLEGRRIWNTALLEDLGDMGASTFDGTHFWAAGIYRLLQIDTTGRVVNSISIPRRMHALTWTGGTLWYAVPDSIIELDLDSSLALGEAVPARGFWYPHTLAIALSADSAGFITCSRTWGTNGEPIETFYQYTIDGQLRDTFISDLYVVESISWDGESLWTLHHGPFGAQTDATLLSRFTLE